MTPISFEREKYYVRELILVQLAFARAEDTKDRDELKRKFNDIIDKYMEEGGSALDIMHIGYYDRLVIGPYKKRILKMMPFLKRYLVPRSAEPINLKGTEYRFIDATDSLE